MENSEKRDPLFRVLMIIAAIVVIVWGTLEIVERVGYTIGRMNCTC